MKIGFISDTHCLHQGLEFPNDIDMIIHSGDFSHNINQANEFYRWYSELDIKYKILIPGNHELHVERDPESFKRTTKALGIIGLIDEGITIEGISIYGSSWTPEFFNWAYMEEDYLLDEYWDKIPNDTNILITHGPAYGILDGIIQYGRELNVGSSTLGDAIQGLKDLKIHTFGHIHEARGHYKENGVLHINASSVDKNYHLCKPRIFEYPKCLDTKE